MKSYPLIALALFVFAAVPAIAQTPARPSDEELRDANRHGTILVGMNEEEVRKSFGAPDRINSVNSASGAFQQWVYNNRNNERFYLYFRGGILVSWQTASTR